MLWLHITALFQTACRTEGKPEFRVKNLPPNLEMGEGILAWPKTKSKRRGRFILSCVFPKGSVPKGRNWSHHFPGDRTEVLGSLRGKLASWRSGKAGMRWRAVRMHGLVRLRSEERGPVHWQRLGRGPQREEWPGDTLFVGRIINEFS